MSSWLAHSNRLGTRMFQAIVLPLANRRRLSSRTNRQRSWCRRVSSAPKMPSQGPLSVLAIAEHAGRLPPVRLATVDGILPLPDVGDHAHPEQQLAIVVRVVPLVPVKEAPHKVKPAMPVLSQHDWKHGRVVDVAGRGEHRQHDLQAQDGRYVVFLGLLACLDEVVLLPVRPQRIRT